MSNKDSNNKPVEKRTKSELVELVKELERGSNIKELKLQMDEILARNVELEEKLAQKAETEKFVGIEKISDAHVWLPDPISRSGRPEDREKGRLLTKPNQLVVIPSYWMIEYIAEQNPSFTQGDVRVNNELAKKHFPAYEFANIDLPDSFIDAAVMKEEIEKKLTQKGEAPYDYLNSFAKKPLTLSRIVSVLYEMLRRSKVNTAEAAAIHALYEHGMGLLNPPEKEKKEVPDEEKVAIQ